MEFLPKFSGADCNCLQTCRRLLDFCVILCYYEYRNAPVRSRKPAPVCAPGIRLRRGNERTCAARKSPPGRSAMHRSTRRAFFPDDPYTSRERYCRASGRRRAVRIKESISRISPENLMQNAAAIAAYGTKAHAHPHGACSQSQRRSLKNAPSASVSSLRSPAGAACAAVSVRWSRRPTDAGFSVYSVRCPAVSRGIAFCEKKTAFRKRSPHRSGCLPPIRRPCPFAETGSSAVPRCAMQTAGAAASLLYPIPAVQSRAC